MKTKLNEKLVKLFVTMQCLLMREEGQDLVEYVLLIALIAFAATVGMTALATKLNAAFTTIGTTLTTYVT